MYYIIDKTTWKVVAMVTPSEQGQRDYCRVDLDGDMVSDPVYTLKVVKSKLVDKKTEHLVRVI